MIKLPRTYSHTFTIKNVTAKALKIAEVDKCIQSPPFEWDGKTWSIAVYLNGDSAESAGFVSAYLILDAHAAVVRDDGVNHHSVGAEETAKKAAFIIIDVCGAGRSGVMFYEVGAGWGATRFVSHDTAASWLALSNGTLAFTATFKPVGITSISNPRIVSESSQAVATLLPHNSSSNAAAAVTVLPSSMASQWRALLSSGDGADIALECGSERLLAHSCVLSLRSPVFKVLLAQRQRDREEQQLAPASPPATNGAGAFAADHHHHHHQDAAASSTTPLLLLTVRLAEIEPPILRKLLVHMYTDEVVDFADFNEARCCCYRCGKCSENSLLLLILASSLASLGWLRGAGFCLVRNNFVFCQSPPCVLAPAVPAASDAD